MLHPFLLMLLPNVLCLLMQGKDLALHAHAGPLSHRRGSSWVIKLLARQLNTGLDKHAETALLPLTSSHILAVQQELMFAVLQQT